MVPAHDPSMQPDSLLPEEALSAAVPPPGAETSVAATSAAPRAQRLTLARRIGRLGEDLVDAWDGFAPDYVGRARRLWLAIVGTAMGVMVWSVWGIARDASLPLSAAVVIIGLAVIARLVPVEIRGARSDHVVSDAIIACAALLHGAPLAVLAAAAAAGVETHQRTKRRAVLIFNAALHALTMGALLTGFDAAYNLAARFVERPEVLLLGRALGVVLVLVLHLATFKSLQQRFFALKAAELQSLTQRGSRGIFRLNFADASGGVLAATLYLLVCGLGLAPLGQITLFLCTLLITLPLHSRQRSLSAQIQRLRLVTVEGAAREASTSLQRVLLNEARFYSAFADAAVGMVIIEPFGRVLTANRAMKALLGQEDLVGRDIRRYVHREDVALLAEQLNAIVARETGADDTDVEHRVVEMRCIRSDGSIVVVAMHSGVFREPSRRQLRTRSMGNANDSGAGLRLIVQMQDVTRMHEAQAEMRRFAYFDGLTRLCNRVFFTGCLERAVENTRLDPARRYALMYLDFDRFKLINDLHGHAAGDAFLVLIAERLRNGVRPGDIVARLGGDEFAILVEGLPDEESVLRLGTRILESLREPYDLGGVLVRSSASIGVALATPEHADASSLMRAADAAMYRAKAEGRDQIVMFGAALRLELEERLVIERDLATAVERDELELAYQPIFRLDTQEVVALEALLRWRHPTLGDVSPQKLVAVAEETAIMPDITRWVVRAACAQISQLTAAGFGDIGIHVNVSGSDVGRADFVSSIAGAIAAAGIRPHQVTVEITESTLMQHLTQCGRELQRLRDMGVGISIDDFGTGYSSLSYFGQLPITSMKIDRSFVTCIASGGRDVEVVRLMVAMAATMGKRVIAEGIESVAQVERLRELGCALGQGYWISRPIPRADLLDWIRSTNSKVRAGDSPAAVVADASTPALALNAAPLGGFETTAASGRTPPASRVGPSATPEASTSAAPRQSRRLEDLPLLDDLFDLADR